MSVVHNCGGGCSCTNCGGCIRYGGTRCHIFPKSAQATAIQPLATPLSMNEIVTIDVDSLTLAEVGHFVGSVAAQPLAIPAMRAPEMVTLRMEDVPLSTVVQRLGLLTTSG